MLARAAAKRLGLAEALQAASDLFRLRLLLGPQQLQSLRRHPDRLGNPAHPGSRGRNCAKGPATLNQMYDPERILHPLRRSGQRGSGEWDRVSRDDALTDTGQRRRRAVEEGRQD